VGYTPRTLGGENVKRTSLEVVVLAVALQVLPAVVLGEDAEAPLAPGVDAPASNSLLITGVSLIETSSATTSSPKDILIEAGSIVQVADAGSLSPSLAATTLHADGLFALPGLINVHAHLGDGGLGEQTDADRAAALAQFLSYGVTTIFVPGGGGGNDDKLARWKGRCSSDLRCPGLFGSGALITAPGSHPISSIWRLPDDTDPAIIYERGAVALAEDEAVGPLLDHKVALGADAIKIIIEDSIGPAYPTPRLSNAKIAELVEAGHERGLKVFAHVSMPGHVEDGVAGGIDGIMHSAVRSLSDQTLAEMARRGVFYVATLSLYDGFLDRAFGRLDEEAYAIAGVSPRALESLRGFRRAPYADEQEARAEEFAVADNLRRAVAAGVPLALGTDTNNPSVYPGYSTHEELALMVEAGLTPAQALAAATTGSASFLDKQQSLGSIAAGYEADLLLLTRNPLDDILNSRSLHTVVLDGRIITDLVSDPEIPLAGESVE